MSAVLKAEGLSRIFTNGGGDVTAVRDAELAVDAGELVVVVGRSGAGKTTLLTMLGGLDRPTSGRVLVDGADLAARHCAMSASRTMPCSDLRSSPVVNSSGSASHGRSSWNPASCWRTNRRLNSTVRRALRSWD